MATEDDKPIARVSRRRTVRKPSEGTISTGATRARRRRTSVSNAADYADMPTSPARFINRELSWLDFNQRVIEEAESPRNPLLERVRFLSISASNLDEFYSVRVAGLVGQVREGTVIRSPDGATPVQQQTAVRGKARYLLQEQQRLCLRLRAELPPAGIVILPPDSLDEVDRAQLATLFDERIFPVLTPLAVDPSHPLPFIPNMGLALVMRLKDPGTGTHVMDGLILMPAQVPRFMRLPSRVREGDETPDQARFVLLEDLIILFADRLFPGLAIGAAGVLRIIRDTDAEFMDEGEDPGPPHATALHQRRRGFGVTWALDGKPPEPPGRDTGEVLGAAD